MTGVAIRREHLHECERLALNSGPSAAIEDEDVQRESGEKRSGEN